MSTSAIYPGLGLGEKALESRRTNGKLHTFVVGLCHLLQPFQKCQFLVASNQFSFPHSSKVLCAVMLTSHFPKFLCSSKNAMGLKYCSLYLDAALLKCGLCNVVSSK